MQFHEIIRENDPDRIFAKGGAMEAMTEAQKAGKVRYIGFTGHKSPAMHLGMLEDAEKHGVHFDAVQMPLNVADAHYDSFEKLVLPVLIKKKIGVLGMKPFAGGFLIKNQLGLTPEECLRYAMSLPVSVTITGCDSMKILEQALKVVREFQPMSESADRGAPRAHLINRRKGKVGALQNGHDFRRHEPQSAVARITESSESSARAARKVLSLKR